MGNPDYFDIFCGANEQWYWNLHNGGNHSIIATSGEGFVSHSNALRAVKNFVDDVRYAFIPGTDPMPPSMAQDDILEDTPTHTAHNATDQTAADEEDEYEPEKE